MNMDMSHITLGAWFGSHVKQIYRMTHKILSSLLIVNKKTVPSTGITSLPAETV